MKSGPKRLWFADNISSKKKVRRLPGTPKTHDRSRVALIAVIGLVRLATGSHDTAARGEKRAAATKSTLGAVDQAAGIRPPRVTATMPRNGAFSIRIVARLRASRCSWSQVTVA